MAVQSATTGSLQSPPLVIRQSRGHIIYWMLFALAVLGFGLSGYAGNVVIGGLVPESLGIIYAGAVLMLLTTIAWARPARITISSSGFRYRQFFSSRNVAWGDIAGVHGRGSRGRQGGVSITLSKGHPLRLSGKWPVSRDELERVIRQARRQWGR